MASHDTTTTEQAGRSKTGYEQRAEAKTTRHPLIAALARDRSSTFKLLLGLALTLLIVLPVLIVPLVSPYDPIGVSLGSRLRPPFSPGHLLGTDQLGRDLLARLASGGRISLTTGFLAVITAGVFGTILGLIAGNEGGAIDALISRLIEVQMSLPLLMFLLLIIAVFGQNIAVIAAVLAIAQWPESARLARSLSLVEREKLYIEAATVIGASRGTILFRHIVPNILSPIMTVVPLLLAQAILIESALSYLGLGVTRPYPTWGRILADGQEFIATAWWVVTIPGLIISTIVLGVNLFAEGLREIVQRGRD